MPHPSSLPPERLAGECRFEKTRRKGPGGQHRNKVETAVIATHQPTKISAEASERRSAAENRRVALFRLRMKLALHVRAAFDAEAEPSELWRSRVHKGRISVSTEHSDFPALLAEAIDAASGRDYDIRAAAEQLRVTASQLTKLFRAAPEALAMINAARHERKLPPLK